MKVTVIPVMLSEAFSMMWISEAKCSLFGRLSVHINLLLAAALQFELRIKTIDVRLNSN